MDYIEGASGCLPTDIYPSVSDVLYLDFEFTRSVTGSLLRAATFSDNGYASFDVASIPKGSYSDVAVRFGYGQNVESVTIPFDTARHQTFYYRASVLDGTISHPTGVVSRPLTLLYKRSVDDNGRFVDLLDFSGARLYQVALYSLGGELLCNMLPCTNSDGVDGLYDVMSAMFYSYKLINRVKKNISVIESPLGGIIDVINSVSLTYPAASDVQLRFTYSSLVRDVTIPQGSTSASVGNFTSEAGMSIITSEDVRYFYLAEYIPTIIY